LAEQADRWREMLDRHGPALLLFARQWSINQADAEDALQNGFVKFWKTRERARDELAWLYTCVRSAAMDLGRGNRRRIARERKATVAQETTFDSSADRAEREAMIESALRQLLGDQREVLAMKIWGGLTFAQIAAALNIPLNTAASRYRYAIGRLSQDLSKEMTHE
jgi:RNA polymerase sigma-70 factor, ECF subfamily